MPNSVPTALLGKLSDRECTEAIACGFHTTHAFLGPQKRRNAENVSSLASFDEFQTFQTLIGTELTTKFVRA